ncbi:MAG: hypothetical protein RIR51_2156 [Bacteroidota bacterium]
MQDRDRNILIVLVLVGILFLSRIFYLQVIDDSYKLAAENNAIRKKVQIPLRGEIYDRNGKLIVYNTPIYDLMVVPGKVSKIDTQAFCDIFQLDINDFRKKFLQAKKYSRFRPSSFLKNLSKEEFALAQDRMQEFKGFYFVPNAFRTYQHKGLSNALGYVAEISPNALENQREDYYSQGDYIGVSGIESFYEEDLRGKRGVKYVMVNSNGVEKGDFKNGQLNEKPLAGETLISSIDIQLQDYADSLMRNKVGSIVAIEPSTGEILAMVSAPSYDPELLAGKNFSKYYGQLALDPAHPLINRPPSAYYRPGSTFKIVQALVGLQMGFLTPSTVYGHANCPMKCHGHASPTNDLAHAIQYSCNPYFYHAFRNMIYSDTHGDQYQRTVQGLTRWNKAVEKFGFGRKLGLDLGNEKKGLLPDANYYDRVYKGPGNWKFSNIYSLSIGEGELIINPVKIANLAAIVANKGWYIPPHLIKGIGEDKHLDKYYSTKIPVGVDEKHFQVVIDGMQAAVEAGTVNGDSHIPGITICGKTGTSQNAKGRDHAIFMAFAPRENPKIAIAVFVENGGFGGSSSAPIASLIMEKYLKGKVERKNIEEKYLNMNYSQYTNYE